MQNLEQIPANEDEIIATLGERLKAKIISDNAGDKMRRDAHPKMHGLVKAEFSIESDLPEELAIGVFAELKEFPAWIRFSNALGEINPDNKGDIRGMAIKLMGVPGEKLLAAEKNAQTHDFLVVSTDVFIVKDVAEFAALFEALVSGARAKIMFFATHWRVIKILYKSMIKFANPLQIRYFSTTPYLLGERAVKYSVIPQSDTNDKIPSNPSNNFLREAMIRQLDKEQVVFDFCVQFQRDPVQMPIEDPGKLWDETLSPFLKVATITIPRQSFSTPERDELGENLSFTPWHALAEHRPLGGINRARKVVYDIISTFRHKENKQMRQEPVDFDS